MQDNGDAFKYPDHSLQTWTCKPFPAGKGTETYLAVVILASLDLVAIDGDAGNFCSACGGNCSHGSANSTAHIQTLHALVQP